MARRAGDLGRYTRRTMTHDEFVSGYRGGNLAAHVDQSMALRVMESSLTAKRYRAAHTFWSWIWLLCFPAAIVCFIWVTWWAGLIWLFFGFIMPGAMKKSASSFVVKQALKDPLFFAKCVEAGVLRISERG